MGSLCTKGKGKVKQSVNKLGRFISRSLGNSSPDDEVNTETSSITPAEVFDYDRMYEEIDRTYASDNYGGDDKPLLKQVALNLLKHPTLNINRIAMPADFLEQRSLLELLASFIRPQLFVTIPEGKHAEERMINVVAFYLSGFSSMRGESTSAKKPCNSILSEACTSRVPDPACCNGIRFPFSFTDAFGPTRGRRWQKQDEKKVGRDITNKDVRFIGEQVSHHPVCTAFYVDCVAAKLSLSATIQLEADIEYNFSIIQPVKGVRVNHLGLMKISDDQHNETYELPLPTAYSTDVLHFPQLHFTDKVELSSSSGYSALLTFDKGAVVKGRMTHDGQTVATINGHWNGTVYITPSNSPRRTLVDAKSLVLAVQRTPPVAEQAWNESRRLWRKVIRALVENDSDRATEEKQKIEDYQRQHSLKPKLFRKVSSSDEPCWVFKDLPKRKSVTVNT